MIFNELNPVKIEIDNEPTIGIELEYVFTPNVHKARYVAETLLKHKYIGLDTTKKNYVFFNGDLTEEFLGMDAINACIMFYLNSMYKELHWKPVHLDPDVHPTLSLEMALTNLSFDNLITNRAAVQHMLTILEGFYYTVTPKTGMHFNLDYEFFGDTTDEIADTLEKFYIFCYDNPDFLTSLTNRPDFVSSFLSDIRAMIGDPLNINKQSAKDAFIKDKVSFITKFREDPTKKTSLYNIVFNKEGRKAAENRQFASTFNFYNALSRLETLLFITKFCKTCNYNDLHTSKYLEFIEVITSGENRTSKGVWTDVRQGTIQINKSLLV